MFIKIYVPGAPPYEESSSAKKTSSSAGPSMPFVTLALTVE